MKMVNPLVTNYGTSSMEIQSNFKRTEPENTISSITNTTNEDIQRKEIQYSVFEKLDLKTLKDLKSKMELEKVTIVEQLDSMEKQLPELLKQSYELEVITKLADVTGVKNNIGADDVKEKLNKLQFDIDKHKLRLNNIIEILPVIDSIIPDKMLNDRINDVVNTFIDINKLYQSNRKKLEKGDYVLLNQILNKLFSQFPNLNSLDSKIKFDNHKDLNPNYHIVSFLENKLQDSVIHLKFLNDDKLFKLSDLFNGTFNDYLIESLDNFFNVGNSYIFQDDSNE